VLGFYYNAKRVVQDKRWLLRAFLFSIPVPWIAAETGWFVAEFGRQPWAIGEVLPTSIAASSLTANDVMISLTGFIVFYTALFLIEMYLMFKFGAWARARCTPAVLTTRSKRPTARHAHGGAVRPRPRPRPSKNRED
jgi:cytochrome d ubiquinol oxidase subunit I